VCDSVRARAGVERQQFTTQIEHYDDLAALCHAMSRIHTILIDFAYACCVRALSLHARVAFADVTCGSTLPWATTSSARSLVRLVRQVPAMCDVCARVC
jgi:hypothetical protein